MSSPEVFPVPQAWAERARIDADGYEAACDAVRSDPDGYWRKLGQRLTWITPPTEIKDVSFHQADFRIRWYADGVLNVSANCLDRHLAERGDQVALIWEGDDPADSRRIPASPSGLPTPRPTPRPAAWPMCSKPTAFRRAIASPSTCR